MIARVYEVNFDGIVGQTHNYSGLGFGNLASMQNKNMTSNPKKAALQGLEKAMFLRSLGIHQAVLPPRERPHIPTLRALGFSGRDRSIPGQVYQIEPKLLFNYSSASAMWSANIGTFTPSIDSSDGKVHITPSNFSRTEHRSLEPEESVKILKAIFPSKAFFTHHPPLPFGKIFGDEGSANHTRFCKEYGEVGVHLFVYGDQALGSSADGPKKFPSRQSLEASQAIARAHKIPQERVIFARQSPEAIDSGVFHNDVISVGDKNFFLYHEHAFANKKETINQIQEKVLKYCNIEMQFLEVTDANVLMKTAIETYLFNAQLISQSEHTFTLILPEECKKNHAVNTYLEKKVSDIANPLKDLHFINLKESMMNGGGPACLRTRVVLTQEELQMVNSKVLLDETLYENLKSWILKHYRDSLTPKDLQDPKLVDEVQMALDELSSLLGLGNIYSFQV